MHLKMLVLWKMDAQKHFKMHVFYRTDAQKQFKMPVFYKTDAQNHYNSYDSCRFWPSKEDSLKGPVQSHDHWQDTKCL